MILLPVLSIAQNNKVETFIAHKCHAIKSDSGEPIVSDVDVRDAVFLAWIGDKVKLLKIDSFALTYTFTIVEQEEEMLDESKLSRTYYGYENIDGVGTIIASVFFFSDLAKNESFPENIVLRIEGSPNIIVYSGIIKLDE